MRLVDAKGRLAPVKTSHRVEQQAARPDNCTVAAAQIFDRTVRDDPLRDRGGEVLIAAGRHSRPTAFLHRAPILMPAVVGIADVVGVVVAVARVTVIGGYVLQ